MDPEATAAPAESGGTPWAPIGAGIGALIAVAGISLFVLVRRRRPATA